LKYILYIILAFFLWFVMFVLKPFNFWASMAFSTSLLSVISLLSYKDQLKNENWKANEIFIGIGSAILLYGIFWFGKFVLDSIGIIPGHRENISNVYANQGSVPSYVVGLSLFFPIGFGEEIFWRGYLQRVLGDKFGKWKGFYITVFFYTAVHIPTLNPVLILASFLVGIFWGLIFVWRSNNIVPGMISHMVWDPLIFIIAPLN